MICQAQLTKRHEFSTPVVPVNQIVADVEHVVPVDAEEPHTDVESRKHLVLD